MELLDEVLSWLPSQGPRERDFLVARQKSPERSADMAFETISVRLSRSTLDIPYGLHLQQRGNDLTVGSIEANSMAQKAGLQPGDVVQQLFNANNLRQPEAEQRLAASLEVIMVLRRPIKEVPLTNWNVAGLTDPWFNAGAPLQQRSFQQPINQPAPFPTSADFYQAAGPRPVYSHQNFFQEPATSRSGPPTAPKPTPTSANTLRTASELRVHSPPQAVPSRSGLGSPDVQKRSFSKTVTTTTTFNGRPEAVQRIDFGRLTIDDLPFETSNERVRADSAWEQRDGPDLKRQFETSRLFTRTERTNVPNGGARPAFNGQQKVRFEQAPPPPQPRPLHATQSEQNAGRIVPPNGYPHSQPYPPYQQQPAPFPVAQEASNQDNRYSYSSSPRQRHASEAAQKHQSTANSIGEPTRSFYGNEPQAQSPVRSFSQSPTRQFAVRFEQGPNQKRVFSSFAGKREESTRPSGFVPGGNPHFATAKSRFQGGVEANSSVYYPNNYSRRPANKVNHNFEGAGPPSSMTESAYRSNTDSPQTYHRLPLNGHPVYTSRPVYQSARLEQQRNQPQYQQVPHGPQSQHGQQLQHGQQVQQGQGVPDQSMDANRPEFQHLQYNSPINLYSPEAAVEAYQQQTGQRLQGFPQFASPPVYLTSPTRQLIAEEEGSTFGTNSTGPQQSASFRRLANAVGQPLN